MAFMGLGSNTKSLKSKRSMFTGNSLYQWQYDRELPHDENLQYFLNEYRGWIYTCSSKNATSVASAKLRLYAALPEKNSKVRAFRNKDVSGKQLEYLKENNIIYQKEAVRASKKIVEIHEHPFLDLLTNVNSFINTFSLFELTELHLELTGNAYWYVIRNKIGIPQEIWIVPPHNMKIIPDRFDFIKGYEYQLGSKKIFYKEKDIVHFKFPSPISTYYGYSPLSAIKNEQHIYNQMNNYETSLFQNMGRLDGAFETTESLGDHEFERLKKEIKENFLGVHNQGKSPLLDNGLTFKPYSWAPKELAYINGRTKIKETIVNAYNQSLGMYDSNATRSNSDTATYNFMKTGVLPRLKRLEEKINEKIMPLYDDKLFVAFDNVVPEDKEFRLKELRTHLDTGYSTVNLERQADNKEPLPYEYADHGFMQVNMAPADAILQGMQLAPSEAAKRMELANSVKINSDVESLKPIFDETSEKINNLNILMQKFEERMSQVEMEI